MKKLLVFVLGLAAVAVIMFSTSLSCVNKEVELRNAVKAKQKANMASFDTMWKILKTMASIPDQYKKDFKEIWPDIIRGRYEQGNGKMMVWIQEHNPEFQGGELYMHLMDSMEVERKRFLRDQQTLIDLNAQRDNMIDKPVSHFFLNLMGSVEATQKIEIIVITSEVTEQTFQSGQENDIDLFSKE